MTFIYISNSSVKNNGQINGNRYGVEIVEIFKGAVKNIETFRD